MGPSKEHLNTAQLQRECLCTGFSNWCSALQPTDSIKVNYRVETIQYNELLWLQVSNTVCFRPATPRLAAELPLLCVCVNHYLRCSQHNGTSWEYGLCDAGGRCCQNTAERETEPRGGRVPQRALLCDVQVVLSAHTPHASTLCSDPQNFLIPKFLKIPNVWYVRMSLRKCVWNWSVIG